MASKQDIAKATQRLVDAQKRSVAVGGLLDMTITDQESQGEEIQEDVQSLESLPFPLSVRETGV